MKVADNLQIIKDSIAAACVRSNRDPKDIKIIAVTKYVTVERALEALDAGILDLGENREEGIIEKKSVLADKPVWHFIGSLQTRKVKNIVNEVDYIHSLDRLSLAKEIDKRATKKIKCFIQVNVSGEESKHGLSPEQVMEFVKELEPFTKIEVAGLMTMAPFTEDGKLLRKCFKQLKEIQGDIQQLNLSYAPCVELSMGMSNDYTIAIEEGATMVRIGTALVG